MTLNSVAIAITSAPSVADIGLREMPRAATTSPDHPVAISTGIRGTIARLAERYIAASTTPTAASPARGSHQRLLERSVFASAARTGSPASWTVVPAGGAGPPGGS